MDLITREQNESPRDFIKRLAEENREFYQSPRGEGALRDFGQKFPRPWIYVAELIQNAIDENATVISFKIKDERTLIFEHNGEPFDFGKDVIGLCTKGMSTKGAGTVGFMGVGFKSVFGCYQRVNISSNEWSFYTQVKFRTGDRYGDKQREWLGAMCPVWDETIEKPSEGMTCRFELSDRCIENRSIDADLNEILKKDLALLPLLAKKGVQTLIWNNVEWTLSVTETTPFEDESGARIRVEATSDTKKTLSSWLIFSQEYSPSHEAVRRFLEHRQLNPSSDEEKEKTYRDASRNRRVEAFFKLKENGFPEFPKGGEAFALLPTNVKLPVGVHIQADWLLTQSRQEFMDADLKTNVWHREIIMSIPKISREFFRWIVGESGPASGDWIQIYKILPALDEKALDSYSWFFGGDEGDPITTSPFLQALQKELFSECILPVHRPENSIDFKTPAEARLLPKSLNDYCGNEEMVPWELFGTEVVDTTFLEEKSLDTLAKLGLLSELTASELEVLWKDGKVKTWYENFSEQDRFSNLSSVLNGLAPLDSDLAWKSAKLACLPAQSGQFITREDAILYPSDWIDITQDESLLTIMKDFLSDDETMIDWNFQKHVQNSYTRATHFFKEITQYDLNIWAQVWWDSLPTEVLDPDLLDHIVRFTQLVCKNHPNKHALIAKVLCEKANSPIQLLPLQETLLADPYTESYRKVFFPDLPVISPKYYEHDDTAEWKSFFESCSPAPQGKLELHYSKTIMDRWEFSKHYHGTPPEQRSSYFRLMVFNGKQEITNSEFGVFDFAFPSELKKSLFEERNDAQLKKMLSWLSEDISYFEKLKDVWIYYIPYFSSESKKLPNDWVPEWIKLLRDNPWLYSSDNRGPFRPAEILTAHDAARPDAPVVASMPERLVRIFAKHNIIFGSAIPKPGPLRELQVHGGTWPLEKISETIAEIIESAATTEEEKQTLAKLLSTEPMIPLPKEVRLVDRSTRMSIQRIVKRAGLKNRSDLGWVVAEQELRTNPEHDQFFALIESIISTPEQLTGDQIIDFLQWIWETEPESELVRKALPLAYAYIIEDRAKNPAIEERWNSVIEDAKVFTLGGNWVKTSDEGGVFFDDIGFSNYSVIPKARRVTPTHLGSNNKPDNQKAAASLLNVRLVSDKFELVPIEGDHLPLPSEWAQNFSVLYVVLAELLRQNKSTDDDEDDAETPVESVAPPDKRTPLMLKLVTKLENVARNKETAEIIDRKALAATLEGSVAIVSGEPEDFADELCILVFQYFDAARRQNLLPITNQVTLLLSQIGGKKFLERLNKFTKKHGLKEVKQLVKEEEEKEEELPADEAPVPAESATTKPSDVRSLLEAFEEDDADFDNPSDDFHTDNTDDLDIDDVLGFYENGSSPKKPENTQPLSSPHKESCTPSSFAAKSHTGKNAHWSDAKSTEAAPPVKPGRGKASSESHAHSPSNRRLLSYVQNANHESANDHLNEAENENETLVVGRAGEMAAMVFERQRGWTPTKMPHNNPGYDIESIGPNGEKIYIEVKGVSGEWSESGVAVSATQFEFAQQNPESTWLYVVENVGIAGEERVYPILNPAKQVTEFRFDSGWKSVAQTMQQSSSSANSVEVGSRVRDLNGDSRTGTITEVTARGKFLLVKILFDDDTESQTLFTPDRFELI